MRRALLGAIRKRPRLAAAFVLAQMLPLGTGWLKHLESVEVRAVEGIEADLYIPRTARRLPGLVLLQGALLEGREYGPLRELAAAVARAGYAVLVPELGRLRRLELGRDAVRDALRAVAVLKQQPDVFSSRVGIYGFSAGGTVGLLAAAEDQGHDIAFVGALGGYIWLEDLITQVTTRSATERTTAYAVVNSMIELLPPSPGKDTLRSTLRSAEEDVLEAFARLPREGLPADVEAVLAVIRNRDPAAVASLLERLDDAHRRGLDELSPGTRLERIRTAVWVLHDRNDPYIAVEQALRLQADRRAVGFHILITSALEHVELRGAALSPFGRAWVYLRNLPALLMFVSQPLELLQRARAISDDETGVSA